jgi:hypothetical protein
MNQLYRRVRRAELSAVLDRCKVRRFLQNRITRSTHLHAPVASGPGVAQAIGDGGLDRIVPANSYTCRAT